MLKAILLFACSILFVTVKSQTTNVPSQHDCSALTVIQKNDDGSENLLSGGSVYLSGDENSTGSVALVSPIKADPKAIMLIFSFTKSGVPVCFSENDFIDFQLISKDLIPIAKLKNAGSADCKGYITVVLGGSFGNQKLLDALQNSYSGASITLYKGEDFSQFTLSGYNAMKLGTTISCILNYGTVESGQAVTKPETKTVTSKPIPNKKNTVVASVPHPKKVVTTSTPTKISRAVVRTDESISYEFNPIPVFKTTSLENIKFGDNFMLGSKKDGSIWAWGKNNYGQMGNGTEEDQNNIFQLAAPNTWKAIECGNGHITAIKNDGSLWDWGLGGGGERGSISSPKQKGFSTDWSSVVSGSSHNILIKNDGTLWAFGSNYNGELGNGAPLGSFSNDILVIPVQIGLDKNWKKVFCGNNVTFALKADGSYWAWGENEYGQLGVGTLKDINSPVKINNTTDWKDISIGAAHTLILKKDGSIWGFGNSSEGQLGLGVGNLSNQSIPVQIGKDKDWAEVWAGWFYSLAIKKDGTLWAWGKNEFGTLGIGNTISQYTPVQVGKDKDWKKVGSIYSYPDKNTIAIKNDGSIWAWGSKNGWLK